MMIESGIPMGEKDLPPVMRIHQLNAIKKTG